MLQTHVNNDIYNKYCLIHNTRQGSVKVGAINKNEAWSTANLFKSPSNFIAGRSKSAPLFWFVCDFRCGVLLFMVILVIYKYKNR